MFLETSSITLFLPRPMIQVMEKARSEYRKQKQREEEDETYERRRLEWQEQAAMRKAQRERERQSLAFRFIEARKQKALDLEAHRKRLDAMHHDLELKRTDTLHLRSKAIEVRQERSRKSVAYRLASWKEQRMLAEKQSARKKLLEEEMLAYRYGEVEAEREVKALRREQDAIREIEDIQMVV